MPESFWDLGVPHIDEYFGVWAILEDPFRAAVDGVSRLDLRAHIQAAEPAAGSGSRDFAVVGGVAVISLSGPLMKFTSSLSGGSSTVRARRQIRAAVADPEIGSILLHIDSPGGTVSGTRDLADDVAAAGERKVVYSYVEDLGASAAYWIGSQARKIFANPTALIGSIGTFAVIYDLSARAAMEGVRVHVIKAGDLKGAGEPGSPITEQQLAEWQRIVNELNDHFVRGVAQGRGLSISRVRALADGRIHVGEAARALGLIDGVQSLDQVLAELKSKGRSRETMSTSPAAEAADRVIGESSQRVAAVQLVEPALAGELHTREASYQELKAGCPGADAAFLCQQLERRASLDEARTAWMAEQQRRIQQATQETDTARAIASRPGVDPLASAIAAKVAGAGASADPIVAWDEAVAAGIAQGLSRDMAIRRLVRDQPDLHRAYLLAYNDQFGRKVVNV